MTTACFCPTSQSSRSRPKTTLCFSYRWKCWPCRVEKADIWPYLQQIAGSHMFSPWDSWLEIHPETAHRLGISDEETVWLESRRGRAQVRAKLYEGAPPNVVCLPLGYGHTEGSAWGRQGLNPLDFLEEYYEPLAGLPQVGRTYVRIYQT